MPGHNGFEGHDDPSALQSVTLKHDFLEFRRCGEVDSIGRGSVCRSMLK